MTGKIVTKSLLIKYLKIMGAGGPGVSGFHCGICGTSLCTKLGCLKAIIELNKKEEQLNKEEQDRENKEISKPIKKIG